MSMKKNILGSLGEAESALAHLIKNEVIIKNIERGAIAMLYTLKHHGRIFSCGNGGSMCDAMHFAEELSGRYRNDRPGLPAAAISDPGHISCVSNDFGYEHVFARYVECHGGLNDILLGISTSGTSKNIILAAKAAREKGMAVITLTGRDASDVGSLADVDICTPAGAYADRVQELHIKVIHILIEMIERDLFPDNYRS